MSCHKIAMITNGIEFDRFASGKPMPMQGTPSTLHTSWWCPHAASLGETAGRLHVKLGHSRSGIALDVPQWSSYNGSFIAGILHVIRRAPTDARVPCVAQSCIGIQAQGGSLWVARGSKLLSSRTAP